MAWHTNTSNKHYNQYHHDDIASNIDAFQMILCEFVLPSSYGVEAFVQENQHIHQMHLFESKHCEMLFESLRAIEDHFAILHSLSVSQTWQS